jgi:hypothetical protein
LVRLVARRIDRRDISRLLRLLGWAATGACLGAVGPGGPQLLLFPFHLLSRHAVLSHVVEWRSPTFSSPPEFVFLGLVVLTLAVARNGGWEDALPSMVFVAMAMMAARNIPVASLVMCPVLARSLPAISPTPHTRPGRVASIALTVVVVLGASITARVLTQPAYNVRMYPVSELAWMRGHGLLAERVAAPDYVGNYRTWTEGAHAEVFIDDRFDMYPPALVEATLVLSNGLPDWDHVLDRYRIDAVLWERHSPLAQLLARDSRWVVVHQTAKWVIATRAGRPTV